MKTELHCFLAVYLTLLANQRTSKHVSLSTEQQLSWRERCIKKSEIDNMFKNCLFLWPTSHGVFPPNLCGTVTLSEVNGPLCNFQKKPGKKDASTCKEILEFPTAFYAVA